MKLSKTKIKERIKHHREIVKKYDNLVEAIGIRLSRIKDSDEVNPNLLELARLEVELMERTDALKFKQKTLDIWEERAK